MTTKTTTCVVIAFVSFFGVAFAPSYASAAYSGSSTTKNVVVPGLKDGMDYRQLGTSDLEVSRVCMGTMTYGRQNTSREGVDLLNVAFDRYGVNFLDTAEIYPVPPSPETMVSNGRDRRGLP